VGGRDDAELKELHHRSMTRLSATRAAMAEGIVARRGGAALLHYRGRAGLSRRHRRTTPPAWTSSGGRWASRSTSFIASKRRIPGGGGFAQTRTMGPDDGFRRRRPAAARQQCSRWASSTRCACPSACRTRVSWAGLLLSRSHPVAEGRRRGAAAPALTAEYGVAGRGPAQPVARLSTPQSLGLGPSVR